MKVDTVSVSLLPEAIKCIITVFCVHDFEKLDRSLYKKKETADVTPSVCNNRSWRALKVSDDTSARESESSFERAMPEVFNEPLEAVTNFLIA